jgi:hypothetical protein
MSQSLAKIYIHKVFCTKNRHNNIGEDIKGELYNYIGGICKQLVGLVIISHFQCLAFKDFCITGLRPVLVLTALSVQ